MIFYIIIYIIILFIGNISNYKYKSSNYIYLLLIYTILLLTAAFRAEGVDNDMTSYVQFAKEGWGIAEPTFF